ncbi:TetR/AcrR family transcriptional regulator [Granulicoccus sp. GXG6511]|uniref:TetR/AcrR family transcriptional regulator n=1 Tax=Granulicoccus sp. GXG6511 TaxID=3381351 RepID=UPI003D7C90E3
MNRIVKQPEERKAEILAAAAALFAEKGYVATTINDVLERVGIAKGTFYHHFPSKEGLLHTLVDQQVAAQVAEAAQIADAPDLSAPEKIILFWGRQRSDEHVQNLTDHLEQALDVTAHIQVLAKLVTDLGPVLARIVEQGVEEGTFDTSHPAESIDVILAASAFLFDSGLIERPGRDRGQAIAIFVTQAERLLGARPGTLTDLLGFVT